MDWKNHYVVWLKFRVKVIKKWDVQMQLYFVPSPSVLQNFFLWKSDYMYKDLETLNGPLREVLLLIKVLVCMYRINRCYQKTSFTGKSFKWCQILPCVWKIQSDLLFSILFPIIPCAIHDSPQWPDLTLVWFCAFRFCHFCRESFSLSSRIMIPIIHQQETEKRSVLVFQYL